MRNKLIYKKADIDRAGDVLTGKKIPNMARDDAAKILENFRSIHAHPLNVFRMSLLRKSKDISADSLVSQRLKREPSIVRKLKKEKNMSLSQMQDVGGLRAVVPNLKNVYDLRELVKSSESKPAFKFTLIKETDYVKSPKESGYRSIHLIYKYEKHVPAENACRIELQLRTKNQHAWATAVETIGTYLEQPLKQSLGDKKWLELFEEVSKVFKLLEEGKHDIDLFKKVIEHVDESNLVNLLTGLSSATKFSGKRKGKYTLVTLYFKTREVDIKSYPESKLAEANAEYSRQEKKFHNDASVQIVLVSVDNIKNLRKLYPNYFLDTKEFVNILNKVAEITGSIKPNQKTG